jgi:hypothetical protein
MSIAITASGPPLATSSTRLPISVECLWRQGNPDPPCLARVNTEHPPAAPPSIMAPGSMRRAADSAATYLMVHRTRRNRRSGRGGDEGWNPGDAPISALSVGWYYSRSALLESLGGNHRSPARRPWRRSAGAARRRLGPGMRAARLPVRPGCHLAAVITVYLGSVLMQSVGAVAATAWGVCHRRPAFRIPWRYAVRQLEEVR